MVSLLNKLNGWGDRHKGKTGDVFQKSPQRVGKDLEVKEGSLLDFGVSATRGMVLK